MSSLKYFTLHSSFYDLGIFTRIIDKLARAEDWSSLWRVHFQPILLVYAPLFVLFPSSWAVYFLLSLQALALALPGFFLYRYQGAFSFWLFVLYFPLWFNALFDFHPDHLAVPLLFFFFYFMEKKRYGLAWTIAFFLPALKEPFALETAALGLFFLLKAGDLTLRKRILAGSLLFLWGLFLFWVITQVVFPHFALGKRGFLSSPAFSWMGESPQAIFLFLITHPLLILKEIFRPEKGLFFLALFGPFLGLCFLRPVYLLPAAPLLLISLLSHNPNHYGYAHHYTAGLIMPIFWASLKGVERIKKLEGFPGPLCLPRLVLLSSLVFHVLLSPSPLSRLFWSNKVWGFGYRTYLPDARQRLIKKSLEDLLSGETNFSLATQNTLNWAPLASGKYYAAFPLGVISPLPVVVTKGRRVLVDFLVIDLKRPWYVGDQGCRWRAGGPLRLKPEEIKALGLREDPGPLPWAGCARHFEINLRLPDGTSYQGSLKEVFLRLLLQARQQYEIIFEKDGFLILKRKRARPL